MLRTTSRCARWSGAEALMGISRESCNPEKEDVRDGGAPFSGSRTLGLKPRRGDANQCQNLVMRSGREPFSGLRIGSGSL